MCDESLTYLRPHEQGQLAAVANKKGSTYLLEFSEALTINQKNDKLLLTAVNIRLKKKLIFLPIILKAVLEEKKRTEYFVIFVSIPNDIYIIIIINLFYK